MSDGSVLDTVLYFISVNPVTNSWSRYSYFCFIDEVMKKKGISNISKVIFLLRGRLVFNRCLSDSHVYRIEQLFFSHIKVLLLLSTVLCLYLGVYSFVVFLFVDWYSVLLFSQRYKQKNSYLFSLHNFHLSDFALPSFLLRGIGKWSLKHRVISFSNMVPDLQLYV